MANSNEVSGVLQAFYALGATIAPLIATALISKAGLEWYAFYYLMVIALLLNKHLCISSLEGRNADRRAERLEPQP